MNSENSKTSKPHDLVLKLSNKLGLRIGEKIFFLSNLSIYFTRKKLKYLDQHGMINLNCVMGRNPYQIVKIILSIF